MSAVIHHRHSLDGILDTPSSFPPASLSFSARAPSAGSGSSSNADGSSGSNAGGPAPGAGGATRWPALVGLAALGIVICYADRSNMSTAIIPMAQDLGWDKAYQGVVLSAFFLGYATTQILGGTLADRYGGKPVLAAGVALWSLFTGLTPQAAAGGTASLLAARVLLGVGEGVAFPAVHALIGAWWVRRRCGWCCWLALLVGCWFAGKFVAGMCCCWHVFLLACAVACGVVLGGPCLHQLHAPRSLPTPRDQATSHRHPSTPQHPITTPAARNVPYERQSTAVGVITAASYAGTALAFGFSPALIARFGWQSVFHLFGAMAVLWLPLWYPVKVRCCWWAAGWGG